MHSKNPFSSGYDFEKLCALIPELKQHLTTNPSSEITLNFFDPQAVRLLNKSLLLSQFGIKDFDLPQSYLCPPVPGRTDYLLHAADLLFNNLPANKTKGENFNMLDLGCGASAIFSLLASSIFGWKTTAVDIDEGALQNVQAILKSNPSIQQLIKVVKQQNPKHYFNRVIQPADFFDLVVCNPPFHESEEQAKNRANRKLYSLTKTRNENPIFNFGGTSSELWCEGGEQRFVSQMVLESAAYSKQVFWFTSLVAKKTSLPDIYNALDKAQASQVKTIDLHQGNKSSRIVCWTYFNKDQIKAWAQWKVL